MRQWWGISTVFALCVIACPVPGTAADSPAAGQADDFHFIPGTFNTSVGPDGNTAIFMAPLGLVVIDTGRHPAHAQAILDYAASTGLPIIAVVNTHWHFDHTTGNLDMKAAYPDVQVYATPAIDGALQGFLAEPIVASRQQLSDPSIDEDTRERESRFLAAVDQGVVEPDIPVETTTFLPVNGRDLEMNVTHYAVSESDIWIWDPSTRTVFAGDLVTLPAPLFDTGCVPGWVEALDEIARKPLERVVPGHGYIMTADECQADED